MGNGIPITEKIDQLFLELSQFTQAKTGKELALEREVRTLRQQLAGEKEAYQLSDKIATERIHKAEAARDRYKAALKQLAKHCNDADYWQVADKALTEAVRG